MRKIIIKRILHQNEVKSSSIKVPYNDLFSLYGFFLEKCKTSQTSSKLHDSVDKLCINIVYCQKGVKWYEDCQQNMQSKFQYKT